MKKKDPRRADPTEVRRAEYPITPSTYQPTAPPTHRADPAEVRRQRLWHAVWVGVGG